MDFWVDSKADKVIEREDKEEYVCAAGITPSGPKHIGNFREIITVYLVSRALREKGKKVRFLYFWDSFDRFRKIPSDVPADKVEMMKKELGKPVCDVIDPWGCHKSWADHWMTKLAREVADTGIFPEYIKQHELYKKGTYAESIKKALNEKGIIIGILNKFRKERLGKDWWPVIIYCSKCKKDTTRITNYDGKYALSYKCDCGNEETFDFRKKGIVKLRWRVDWPMRWAYYNVDFEPAGKEHMVFGSSRTTGEMIVRDVYHKEPPIGFMYGLIRRKGGEGKMSASHGNVIFVSDALNVYLPEVLRFLFVSNRATKDFQISFDEDVLKIYDDFYECEKAYFGKSELSEKRVANLKRIYELSSIKLPKSMPAQLSFRTAAMIVQVAPKKEWVRRAAALAGKSDTRLKKLLEKADFWVRNHAPARYRLVINESAPKIKLSPAVRAALKNLGKLLLKKDYSAEELGEVIFDLARDVGVKEFFSSAYKVILSRERGPKLAPFIISAGRKKISSLLNSL